MLHHDEGNEHERCGAHADSSHAPGQGSRRRKTWLSRFISGVRIEAIDIRTRDEQRTEGRHGDREDAAKENGTAAQHPITGIAGGKGHEDSRADPAPQSRMRGCRHERADPRRAIIDAGSTARDPEPRVGEGYEREDPGRNKHPGGVGPQGEGAHARSERTSARVPSSVSVIGTPQSCWCMWHAGNSTLGSASHEAARALT